MRGVVVVLTFTAPPALCGLATVQGRPDWTRASSTTPSYLATMFVEACLSVELISRVVLADAKV